ncbi:MAG: hypothetical protein OXF88_01450 [Rhodobacteraceae bacterium]|nr:hypothetical protein [Paracoccaceae bacterium]MCY4141071.1 hypothetical protein [Paracoccaceae bacterium]
MPRPNTYNINIKTTCKDRDFWRPCGVTFPRYDDVGNLPPNSGRLDLFKNVGMVASPAQRKEAAPNST